jgi:hypothetical protein
MKEWAFLGLTMAAACGQAEGGPQEEGGDEWRGPAREQTLEIPPFPDLCSRYEIERVPRDPGSSGRILSCPCGNGFYIPCDESSCVVSFSCEAACQGLSEPAPSLSQCVGECEPGDSGPVPCVALPGGTSGAFATDFCVEDADCSGDTRCLAVTEVGVRKCSSPNSTCNAHADCTDGTRCIRPDASIVGSCGDGRDQSICFSDYDCRANARCVWGVNAFEPELGRCSTGQSRAPCAGDSDCDGGKCFSSYCSTGGLSEECSADGDCATGLRCTSLGIVLERELRLCSDGRESSSCEADSDCVAGLHCSIGLCFDDSNESWCDTDDECGSGRCQVGSNYQTCTSGEPGAPCMDAGDCVGGSCTRQAGQLDWESGTCE